MWNVIMRSLSTVLLHHDILDDYKVILLPESLRWRFVSVIVLAGREDDDGFLPIHKAAAVAVRTTTEQYMSEMSVLAQNELVELRLHDDGTERWFVTQFAKRQAAADATTRKRNQREREKGSRQPVDNSWTAYLAALSTPTDDKDIDQLANSARHISCHDIVTCRDIIDAFKRHGIGRNRRTEALLALPHITAEYVDHCIRHAGGKVPLAIWYMEQGEPVAIQAARCDLCGGNHPTDACAYGSVIQR